MRGVSLYATQGAGRRARRELQRRLRAIDAQIARVVERGRASVRDAHQLRRHCRMGEGACVLACAEREELGKGLRRALRRVRRCAGEVRNADVAGEIVRRLGREGGERAGAARALRSPARMLREARAERERALLRMLSGRGARAIRERAERLRGLGAPSRSAVRRVLVGQTRRYAARRAARPRDPERLHRLRIAARKLIVSLRVLGSPKSARVELSELAGVLGEAQDLAMSATLLRELMRELTGRADGAEAAAYEGVLARLERERDEAMTRSVWRVRRGRARARAAA